MAFFISAATASVERACATDAAERLRPEAEGTLRWTTAGGVQRDKRNKQERNVVLARVDIAFVDVHAHIGMA